MGCFGSKEDDRNAAGLTAAGMVGASDAQLAAEFINGGGLTSRMELAIYCRGLKDKDVMSKSDPLCVVYMKNRSGNWDEIGRTEIVANSLNPDFFTRININYKFEEVQVLKFEIYDVDTAFKSSDSKSIKLADQDFLGQAESVVAKIINCSGHTWSAPVIARSGTQRGNIFVQAEELANINGAITMKVHCSKIPKAGFSRFNPFLRFSKLREDGTYTPCFKTEVKMSNQDPAFEVIQSDLIHLANGDMYRPIQVECMNWGSNGSHTLIGKAQCSLNDLAQLSVSGASIPFNGTNPNSGNLHCSQFQFVPKPSFLEFVKGGTEISVIVAIDYTASNGDPSSADSLHHVDPTGRQLNQYAQAIKGIGSVIEFYDTNKQFPLYGFGGKPERGGPSNHCFAVNRNESSPEVHGVNGILTTYYQSLRSVQLSGPTIFSNIISQASAIAASAPQSQAHHQYFILLILTDGVVNDMDNTISSIVAASGLPLSILIVGVGDSDDLEDMHRLDADKQRLKDANGKEAVRDIVQFTAMKDFKHLNGQAYEEAVAVSLLEEIPHQVVQYFKAVGIMPNQPTPPTPPPAYDA